MTDAAVTATLLSGTYNRRISHCVNPSCSVSRHVSVSRQSQDTIFQSLGLEGLKPRSRFGLSTSKTRKMGKSRPYFKSERKNPQ